MKHTTKNRIRFARSSRWSLLGFTATAALSLSLVNSASAKVIIDYVSVGNAGNAADRTGYGAVAYTYKIAKNETTIGQYAEFLNAAAKSDPYMLYSLSMTTTRINGISRSGSSGSYTYAVNPGSANKPITYVSWFDAARFCNWLHNGQGSGSTETGAYTLLGAMSGINITVNPAAQAWIPSEDEWYKAAYYDATKGGTGGYWPYPTQSNALVGNTIGAPNSANYYDGDYVGYPVMSLTDVGAYGENSASFYGTNDQGGNVWEWNDGNVAERGLRGGSWGNNNVALGSSHRTGSIAPEYSVGSDTGFRVASIPDATPVSTWLVTNGLPHDADMESDPNGDGVTLLTSYALNLDPHNPLPGMPVPAVGPTTMSMSFYGTADGVTYGAETSTDCQTWTTEDVTVSDPDTANMRTVTVNRDAPRRFLRLRFNLDQ